MKKLIPCNLLIIFMMLSLFFSPRPATAFEVTYLHPGYEVSDFLTLDFPTAAIEFDSVGNLYTEDAKGWGSGGVRTAVILKLEASTGYTTSSIYATYQTTGRGMNGLDFDGQGNLLVSEFFPSLNAGMIRRIDTATLSVVDTFMLPDFRPTGIAAEVLQIYFPGRLQSDLDFGNIYRINDIGDLEVFIDGFVGTGIAIDQDGKFFLATSGRDVSPLMSRSIYMLNPWTITLRLIATFNKTVEELNFDSNGNLYALELRQATDTPKIIRISRPVEVTIDIKPGSDPNSINLGSESVITVAILTTDDFDATTVDPSSVEFGPNGAMETHGKGHIEDVDNDGDLDLVLHFKTQKTGISCGAIEAGLTGETFDGQAVEGFDYVNIVRCD